MTTADLDVGVRALVAWLNAEGFPTTDSGDGVSKAELIDAGYALPYPHVFIRVDPDQMVAEAARLRFVLRHRGICLHAMGGDVPSVQATYCPVDELAFLMLMHVDDFTLSKALPA